ncbi:transposase [Longispora fulva]|uniref:transposase n=1 Tax=Longispora fulva TaxID=619741 RepID=UPI0027E550B9|nr:transposase [Longispora fulva]
MPWRDLPERFRPWQTVYSFVRRWRRNGTWKQIVTGLQARADAQGLITWDVSVDSTVARRISVPPVPVKRGRAEGETGWYRYRARRSRTRSIPGRVDHEGAPGG